jgi:hypothetical protein
MDFISQIIVEPELFLLNFGLKEFSNGLTIYEYKVQAESSVEELFHDNGRLSSYAAFMIKGIYHNSEKGSTIITTKQLMPTESKIELSNGLSFNLVQIQGSIPNLLTDESILLKLLNRDLRESLEKSGFSLRGNLAFKTSNAISVDVKSTNSFIHNIIQHVGIYSGFYYRIRQFNGKLFLQITPKSILEFNVDLYDLIHSENFSENSLEYLCQRIRTHDNRIAYFRTLTKKQSNESIKEMPYNGSTYEEYVNKVSRHKLKHPDASLLLIQERRNQYSTYTTSESAKPIIDFTSLSHLDSDLYSKINKKLKDQSSQRRNLAIKFANEITLQFKGNTTNLGPRKSCIGNYQDDPPFVGKFNVDRFFRFKDPVVSFKDENGNVKHASKDTGDNGAPQDLLRNKGYKPFLAPKEISLSIIAVSGLEKEAEKLKQALLNQDDSRILNLQKILGCKFIISEVISINPQEINLPELKSDCAIVVGNKYETDAFGISSNSYVNAEVALLERGIPVQYIIHDPLTYDRSIESKIKNNYVLFGIGISILAKVGGNSMILSNQTTQYFPVNSTVIGYNVARVFEPLNASVLKSQDILNVAKTSIPISASVAIMDQSGAEIIHQFPHIIQDENSLFSGERGQKILEHIPESCTNIIIHKDGPFQSSELEDLAKLKKSGMAIFPVSIVTNSVPRISTSSQTERHLPRAGICVPLSSNEFLLSTTLVSNSYDPASKGWPNPLLVTIYKLRNQNNIPEALRIRIIYQLWSLTR